MDMNDCMTGFKLFAILMVVELSFSETLTFKAVPKVKDIDSIYITFDPINVTAIRNTTTNPISETLINNSELDIYNTSSSLNSVLRNAPSLFALSDFNDAQDSRISIRGFGARSNFGIRGIKILVDGIPESTPDGQGQLDNISIDYFEQISVFRGSTSLLFGNASGGAISFLSQPPKGNDFTKSSITLNTLNDRSLTFFINRSKNNINWNFHVDIQKQKGHRYHSSSHSSILNFQLRYQSKYFETFNFSFNHLHSPYALDPGALTLEQKINNPKMARPENELYDSRESVQQSKLSLKTEKVLNDKMVLKTDIWFLQRSFKNKLPFQNGGQVNLLRNYFGFNSKLIYDIWVGKAFNKIMFGIEMNNQNDSRKRFDNIMGVKGDMSYNGEEKFLMAASFVQYRMTLKEHQFFSGIRIDHNQTGVNDKLSRDSELNYKKEYFNVTPLIGYKYQLNKSSYIFTNYTTHFETPTLYETGNSFELEPQFNRMGEFGIISQTNQWENIELVLFRSKVENEIISLEKANEPGRSYYKNAGVTERMGAEFSLKKALTKKFSLLHTHTFTDYKFTDYIIDETALDGNYLPSIPRYFGKLNFLYEMKKRYAIDLELYYTGEIFLDDNNTHSNPKYLLSNLKIKNTYEAFGQNVTIFYYIGNIFNIDYDSNIRINAWSEKYYEPGPSRYYSIGLEF